MIKNSLKAQLKLGLCVFLGMVSMSSGRSDLDDAVHYEMKMGDLTVGFFSVSDDKSDQVTYKVQLKNRMGFSALSSSASGELSTKSGTPFLEQSIRTEATALPFSDTQQFHLLPWPLQEVKGQTKLQNAFYVKPRRAQENLFLFPLLPGQKIEEAKQLQYDSDGFLNHGTLKIEDSVPIEMNRISGGNFLKKEKEDQSKFIDFGIFYQFKNQSIELENLRSKLGSCQVELDALHREMLKKIPEGSYGLYRQVINMIDFCAGVRSDLDSNAGVKNTAKRIQTLLNEDEKELPYSVFHSPNLFLFDLPTTDFLWPRVLSHLIDNALLELKDHATFEKNRKSLLAIQFNSVHLQPRAVVRARVQMISSASLLHIEKAEAAKGQKPQGFYLRGKDFAQNPETKLSSICSTWSGHIGIDLANAPAFAFSSGSMRGIWDDNGRLEVARQFAIKALSTKECNQIHFRAPQTLEEPLTKKLGQLKFDYLGVDNEILLPNRMQKKILVAPGKYRIVTTSILSGKVLSTHEFDVAPGTYTTVNAKAN